MDVAVPCPVLWLQAGSCELSPSQVSISCLKPSSLTELLVHKSQRNSSAGAPGSCTSLLNLCHMPWSIEPRAQKCLVPKPVTSAQGLLNILCAAGTPWPGDSAPPAPEGRSRKKTELGSCLLSKLIGWGKCRKCGQFLLISCRGEGWKLRQGFSLVSAAPLYSPSPSLLG